MKLLAVVLIGLCVGCTTSKKTSFASKLKRSIFGLRGYPGHPHFLDLDPYHCGLGPYGGFHGPQTSRCLDELYRRHILYRGMYPGFRPESDEEEDIHSFEIDSEENSNEIAETTRAHDTKDLDPSATKIPQITGKTREESNSDALSLKETEEVKSNFTQSKTTEENNASESTEETPNTKNSSNPNEITTTENFKATEGTSNAIYSIATDIASSTENYTETKGTSDATNYTPKDSSSSTDNSKETEGTSNAINSITTDITSSTDNYKETKGTSDATNYTPKDNSSSTDNSKETEGTSNAINSITTDITSSTDISKETEGPSTVASTKTPLTTVPKSTLEENSAVSDTFTSVELSSKTDEDNRNSKIPVTTTSFQISTGIHDTSDVSTFTKNTIVVSTDYSTPGQTSSTVEEEITSSSSLKPNIMSTTIPNSTKLDSTSIDTTEGDAETTHSITTIEFQGTRTLKLAVSITFLVIALGALAVLVVYIVVTRRRTISYDELIYVP